MSKGPNGELGSRIKGLREALGLSKSELADRCEVTTTAVWNWEENGRMPRSHSLELAAKALGVSKSFLVTGVEDTASQLPTTPPRKVAAIIEDARRDISAITGVAVENIRLNVEFVSN